MIEAIQASLNQIKNNKPLILCLTNYVTMDFMANSLLALGAAPLMSEAIEEIEELVAISQAVYINIGTLDKLFMERALLAVQIARSLNKPIIVDPVGSGASKLRTKAALELLPQAHIVRGNASELLSLAQLQNASKGVESIHAVEQAMDTSYALAQQFNNIIVISGPKDFITDGNKTIELPFGSSLMPLITGMGCTLTAVIAAFVSGSCTNQLDKTAQATAFFGLCGQYAEQQAQQPASFKQAFINALYQPDWDYYSQELASHDF